MKLDETRIQYHLSQNLLRRGYEIVVPNWEADLVGVTKAQYLNEFEIKVSKQDFERDFGKKKHYHFRRPNAYMKMPNYFWYVAPIEAIPLCIPDYAGLMEVIERNSRLEIKDIRRPKKNTWTQNRSMRCL